MPHPQEQCPEPPQFWDSAVLDIRYWLDYNFPYRTESSAVLGFIEEVGEFCRTIVKAEQNIRGTKEFWDIERRKEYGDMFVKFIEIGKWFYGDEIMNVVLERWAEVRPRDWIKYPLTGKPPETEHSVVDRGTQT